MKAMLLTILLTGCASVGGANHASYGPFKDQFGQVAKPVSGTVTLKVEFVTKEQALRACNGHEACAFHPAGTRKFWLVFVTPPKDWDDSVAIEQLGHEVLHAFDAEHQSRHVTLPTYMQ